MAESRRQNGHTYGKIIISVVTLSIAIVRHGRNWVMKKNGQVPEKCYETVVSEGEWGRISL